MSREQLIEEAAKVAMKEYQNAHWGKNAFENVAEAVLAVFEKAQCKRCGKIAEGYAFIGDDRYCHPDDGVDCYTLASHDLTGLANQAFIEKAQAPTDTVPHVALYHPDGTPKLTDEVRADAAEIRAKYADDASVMHAAAQIADRNSELMERLAQAPTDELNTSAKKVSMSGGHVNKTADSLHVPTDDEREDMIAWLMRDQGDDLSPLGRDYTDAEIADMLRRPAQGEPSDAAPEGAEVTFFTQLDGYYAEESATLSQAEYVRREASGLIPPAERKITKRVTYWVDMPAAFTTGQEDKP